MPLISLFAGARGDDTVAVVVSCLSEVRRAVSRTCYPQFALWKIPQSSEVCPPTNQLRNFHDLGRILPCPSSLSGRSRCLSIYYATDSSRLTRQNFFHRSIGLSPRDAGDASVGRARCQDRLPRMPPSRCAGPRWRYPCRRQLRLWHRPGESGISSKVGTELARVGRVHPSRTRPR